MSHEIIVADVHSLGMIAVLRSLGRAGYKPHAVSPEPDALGFLSKFAFKSAVHPEESSPDFIPWLRSYVAEHGIVALVCGEAMLYAIRDNYADFERLIPDAAPDEINRLCLSKARVWKCLSSDPATSLFLPKSGILDSEETARDALESLLADQK